MSSVEALLRAVRRRERWSHALVGCARTGLPAALGVGALGVVAMRWWGASPWFLLLAMLPFVGVVLVAWLRPRPLRAVARRVDAHYGLHDVLGSAWEFRHDARTRGEDNPTTEAIVALVEAEARTRATGLDPRPVVPFAVPHPRRHDAIALLALGAAILIPQRRADILEPQLSRPSWTDTAEAKAPRVELVWADALRRQLRGLLGPDDEVSQIAERVLALLDGLENGDLDRTEVYAELDRLDAALADAEEAFDSDDDGEDPELLQAALEALEAALQAEAVTEDAARALAERRFDDADAAFNEAADAADANARMAAQLQRAMEAADRALESAAASSRDTEDRLEEAERRLRKTEQEANSESPEEQERRLKKAQRRVESLRREQARQEAARRRIEALRREAQDAAKRNGGAGKRRDALQKLSREAQGAARRVARNQRLQQGRDGLDEAKSIVRRAGDPSRDEKKRGRQMKAFNRAAEGKGRPPKPGQSSVLIEGELGEGEPMLLEGGDPSGEGDQGGEGEGDPGGEGDGDPGGEGDGDGNGDGSPSNAPGLGDGMGHGSSDALGDPRGVDVRVRDVHVNARAGRGASRAEVIRESSQRGFATEAYQDVYTSYRAFAQSSIDQDSLPSAQRRAIKRYYQLIAPRP